MRKICIALSKGGVGKSSTAVSVAHGLAIAGKKVLLVDTDKQGQDGFLLGVHPPNTRQFVASIGWSCFVGNEEVDRKDRFWWRAYSFQSACSFGTSI